MRLEDLMERAAQYDENLARDIKDYDRDGREQLYASDYSICVISPD